MRLLLIIPLIFIWSLNAIGQKTEGFNAETTKLKQPDFNHSLQKTVETQSGSLYFPQEFIPGIIILNDKSEMKDIPLRYNIYKNAMEFKQKETILEIAAPNTVSRILLDGKIFVYAQYNDSKKIRMSYFQMLTGEKYQLLKKFEVAVPAGGRKPEAWGGQVNIQEKYFLRYKSGMARQITSRNELIKILQPVPEEITDYIRQKRINISNETELTKALIHINNLANH